MNVAVLTGGTSAERTVAIASAATVVAALRKGGHRVTVIDTAAGPVEASDEASFLTPSPGEAPPALADLQHLEHSMLLGGIGQLPAIRDADLLFLALHGGAGEDGTVQAILSVVGVRYTGSGPLASALAMDKDLSKQLFRAAGVKVPAWRMGAIPATELGTLGWPLIVKPSKQGSTVGLTLVHRPEDLAAAYDLAGQYDDEIMVEQFIPGRELTVAILGDEALPVGEIICEHEIFDYKCKYVPGLAREIFPADLGRDLTQELQRQALVAHRALKLGGYSRVDFRLDPAGDVFCLEANTLPGLTGTSLVPQAARAAGLSVTELCQRICDLATDVPSASEHAGRYGG